MLSQSADEKREQNEYTFLLILTYLMSLSPLHGKTIHNQSRRNSILGKCIQKISMELEIMWHLLPDEQIKSTAGYFVSLFSTSLRILRQSLLPTMTCSSKPESLAKPHRKTLSLPNHSKLESYRPNKPSISMSWSRKRRKHFEQRQEFSSHQLDAVFKVRSVLMSLYNAVTNWYVTGRFTLIYHYVVVLFPEYSWH